MIKFSKTLLKPGPRLLPQVAGVCLNAVSRRRDLSGSCGRSHYTIRTQHAGQPVANSTARKGAVRHYRRHPTGRWTESVSQLRQLQRSDQQHRQLFEFGFGAPSGNVVGSGLPTSSILDRTTGGTPSSIFGTIQTNGAGGFGYANLLLMNPAEVIFPSRIGRSEMQAFYLPVGEKYDSSFSILTPGQDPHLNVTLHGRPIDGPAAKLGG